MAEKRTLTLYKSEPTEKIIEKSRFITYSARVESEEEAREFLAALRAEHPFATHVCYAFIADRQGNLQRFSDDGEPQGTAGMPILETLRRKETVFTALAVVRYFGGIKLGAGGLTRAYASAAKEHLDRAEFCEILPCEIWEVSADYSFVDATERLLKKREIAPTGISYDEKVRFVFQVKKSECEALRRALTELFAGKEEIRTIEKKDAYFPV